MSFDPIHQYMYILYISKYIYVNIFFAVIFFVCFLKYEYIFISIIKKKCPPYVSVQENTFTSGFS